MLSETLDLLRFSPVVSHKSCKELIITDVLTLQQNPLHQTEHEMADEVAVHVDSIFSQLPVLQNRMSLICQAVAQDPEMGEVMNYVLNGWPVVSAITPSLKSYYEVRHMSVSEGLLTYQSRIVIPSSQRPEILL